MLKIFLFVAFPDPFLLPSLPAKKRFRYSFLVQKHGITLKMARIVICIELEKRSVDKKEMGTQVSYGSKRSKKGT